MELLVKHGANVFKCDGDGMTPLCLAETDATRNLLCAAMRQVILLIPAARVDQASVLFNLDTPVSSAISRYLLGSWSIDVLLQ